jgi:Cof subfamily protein (haloacid dehalogenase superfamily)
MQGISLILTDLDGTLFHNDKTISNYTKRVIAEAQKKGVLFGISTARARVNAVKFLDGLSPDVLISNGGGMVTYFEKTDSSGKEKLTTGKRVGKKIYSCEFSVQEVRTLIKTAFEVCGANTIMSVDNEVGLYSNSEDELGDKFWTYVDFSDFNEPGMKVCIQTLDKEKIIKIASSVGLEQVDYLPFSDIPWYKMSKKDATKERAIEALCKYLNIQPVQIAAFGDDFNDIGMLKLCGKGIAMENAIAEVRQIADEVCASNEADGVAKWIERFL